MQGESIILYPITIKAIESSYLSMTRPLRCQGWVLTNNQVILIPPYSEH